jgi:prepilin peptidase CpaA
MNELVWVCALACACWAGWLDYRLRRIPNWLTVPALLAGILLNTLAGGWAGAKMALAGAGLMLAVLLPFVIVRGLGAGDWKLMGALGAFLGPGRVVYVLLGTILIAGVMAIVEISLQRKWVTALRNLWELARAVMVFRLRAHPVVTLDNPGMLTVPFGVATAAAAMLCFFVASVLKDF